MKLFRQGLILSHRYLGIAISLLVVVWFASGIVMMYAAGMPRLAPELRLERLPDLDISRVQFSLAEAAEKAGFDPEIGWDGRVTLLMLMDRPAYRFAGGPIVFADTGEAIDAIGLEQAKSVASRFMNMPEDRVHYVRTLTEPDQWTIGQGRQMPQYKFAADDDEGTELYVQPLTGEVSMHTTRQSRLLAWLGVIPHWLYFAPLRVNQALWYDIVVWTSTIAAILAALGLALAAVKFRRPKPFRLSAAIPYTGWMRWHYITGAVFGVFTLTWAFSGILSMEPYAWTRAEGLEVPRDAFTGGAVELTKFANPEPAVWERVLDGRAIKEVDFARIQDEAFYVVRPAPAASEIARRERLHQPYNVTGRAEPDRLLLPADTMEVRYQPFSAESLLARLTMALPDVPIVEQELLQDYDSYYYSRGRIAPLPVLRVKFDDPMRTWVYVDPATSQVLAEVHRLNRVERWLYNGLHSLDFSFWYDSPLWYPGMLVLLLGGLVSSVLGMYLGIARLRRGAARGLAALGETSEGGTPEATPASRNL